MKLPWQRTTWDDSIKANVFLSIAVCIISVIAGFAFFQSTLKHDRIVIVPAVVDRQMIVDWSSADENYIKAFSLSIAQMVGNITPDNVNFVVDAMSSFVHPSIYADLRTSMLSASQTRSFKEAATATRFLPASYEFDKSTGKIFVSGDLELSTAAGKTKMVMTYEMVVKIESGRPVIYSFTNYSEPPHNEDWYAKHAPKKEGEQQ